MKKVLLLAILLLNLLPVMKDGRLMLGTATLSAQNMGNESGSTIYHCTDEDGFEYTSPWPCEDDPCISPCPICDASMPCDELDAHMYVQHNENDDRKDPDEGDVGNQGGTIVGGGSSTGGGGGSVVVRPPSGGGGGSSSQTNIRTTTQIKNAAAKAVRSIPGTDSQCSKGVRLAFKNLYGTLPPGMNCLANEMVSYWAKNPSLWKEITLSEAQGYANNGYFVVAGYQNPGGHGHVVVIVPGKETYSTNWGGKVPCTMDTGYKKRNASQSFSYSFGANKKGKVKFYYYK